jgi:glyoxylase-like metal-dependent hydrolase (beta-lactamase superfamily II)
VTVYLLANNEYDENCYCVLDNGHHCLVIDPGCQAQSVKDFLREEEAELRGILLTHGHFDHITSAQELSEWAGVPIIAAKAEAALLKDPSLNLSAFALNKGISLVPTRLVEDGETIDILYEPLQVIATPGHTPGGVCYYMEDDGIVFTGDTLFREAVGRTDFPLSDSEALTKSINERLFVLPPKTEVYPGHGRSTYIAHERKVHGQAY